MITPEFSRPIALDRIGLKEKSYDIAADEKERAALAERLGIPAVKSFEAVIRLRLRGGGIVRLAGHIKAELTQICVVTLEPIDTAVEEDFTRVYSVEAGDEMAEEVVVDMEEDDVPDPVENGQIDMGEAAAEHLALAMDPFPRGADAAFSSPDEPEEEPAPKVSPFASLAGLRKKE